MRRGVLFVSRGCSRWSAQDDERLAVMLQRGESDLSIGCALGRSEDAVRHRRRVLEKREGEET